VTDDVIRWHLSGHDPDGHSFVAGVYPLLRDETCFFLAVDFDKAGWQQDAAAFLDACRRLNLPTALERSRSGQGAHVWFLASCRLTSPDRRGTRGYGHPMPRFLAADGYSSAVACESTSAANGPSLAHVTR